MWNDMSQAALLMIRLIACFVLAGASPSAGGEQPRKGGDPMNMVVESPAFRAGDMIPAKYTCDGENISPPLKWTSAPEGTKSFALIADDPDAPMGTWVHWVVYNIPASARELPEKASQTKKLPPGSLEGVTDFRENTYGGPCPPSGVHRYFFKLYALDTVLNLRAGASKKQLLDSMKGHILTQAEHVGKYRRH